MSNPFETMNQYTPEMLKTLNERELIQVQRSVLFPHEQVRFDAGESLQFLPEDSRDAFFDFTDRLITELQARSSAG